MDKTKAKIEIDLLGELERGDVVSQLSLSHRVSVSVGLVNAVLKRAIKKGFVKTRAAPYRRYCYYVTPKGFHEKSRLVAEYLETSLGFFRTARSDYVDLFSRAKACGFTCFVLAGDGELAEIAFLASREADADIIAFYDRTTSATHKHGLPMVHKINELGETYGVVITESRCPQDTYNELAQEVGERRLFAPNFVPISRCAPTLQGLSEVASEKQF